MVIGGGDDEPVLVWDPAEPAPARSRSAATGGVGAAVLPDGRVVTGGGDYQVWLRS